MLLIKRKPVIGRRVTGLKVSGVYAPMSKTGTVQPTMIMTEITTI